MNCPGCGAYRKHYLGMAEHLLLGHGNGGGFTCPCGKVFLALDGVKPLILHLREHKLNSAEAWKRHIVESALAKGGDNA